MVFISGDIFGATLVEDPKGGVILVGVSDDDNANDKDPNNIYRLPSCGQNWVKMSAKLKYARKDHSAFFVPDNVASCN